MSAKWRALQHRHKYTYSAVTFPQSYIDSMTLLPLDELCTNLVTQLRELASLTSIYTQVNFVKNVGNAYSDVLAKCRDERLVLFASKLYLELLFLENSQPLQKTLLSALSKNRNWWGVVGGGFRELCEEYGDVNRKGRGRRFCVSRVALAMMSTPKLGYLVDVVEECCVLVAVDSVVGLSYVVKETEGLARPSPLVMEQCQDGLSCLYYLLQRFPSKFLNVGCEWSGFVAEGSSLLEMVVTVIFDVLKSLAFSRDCFVAAGVSFCAALQVLLSPYELGYLILDGVFEKKVSNFVGSVDSEYKNAARKVPYKGDICFELRNLSPLSRLCLIRGILTAVSRTTLNFQFIVERELSGSGGADENGGSYVQSILYDGILPELCKYCENPLDSHFNFHALTVMQICLQQIKTCTLADLVDLKGDFDPIPEDIKSRILRIIWNNLEDTLSQTVKQVHLIFDLFLDIKATMHRGDDGLTMSSFLKKIASDLLRLGSRCKGRYIPLASITKRLGSKNLLCMSPNLLYETSQAYIDDDVCGAITSFLKCFLERLRDECWNSDGVERGYEVYRSHCLPPFLCGLAAGNSKLRSNLNTYALPCLLEVDLDSIFPLFSVLSVGVGDGNDALPPEVSYLDVAFSVEQKVAVLVSLLKVSRSLALFEGDIDSTYSQAVPAETSVNEEHAFILIKGVRVEIPVKWLALALIHVDDSLRVDAAESLFLNPKTASLPSALELNLLRISVPLNMRCCSTAFQMKWGSMFKKFISRVRTALERQFKLKTWQPSDCRKSDNASLRESDDDVMVRKAEDLYQFMKWLSGFLFLSCYPSAPYERKIMAMELIMIMINAWSVVPPPRLEGCDSSSELYPYNEGLTSPDSTMLLVGSIIDSWDRLRESSFRILLNFPNPLPGISSEKVVQEVILWAKNLVCSPRVRESDAGALTVRLIFRKYVVELGWFVRVSGSVVCYKPGSEFAIEASQSVCSRFPINNYINSCIEWLQAAVEAGEKDLFEACRNSFVHGVLLALRYTFEELDWNSDVVLCNISEMRNALAKLLELAMRITSLALWVVSSDAWSLPQDMDDIEEDGFVLDIQSEAVMPGSVTQSEAKESKVVQDERATEQIVMVGCWLAMKEVSLLLGTIIRKIPLPSASSSDGGQQQQQTQSNPISDLTANGMADCPFDAILDLNQLEVIGNHFLEVLLKMKHTGAIDKTRAGFTALCNRLLCSDDPRLCQLTESWMEQLMERTLAKGQTVDDLLRRSAGIPAAFSAFFLSEPQGAPKKLLPRALRWLINVASGSQLELPETHDVSDILHDNIPTMSESANGCQLMSKTDTKLSSSKIRVEGVIPTVHAFNVLRAAFNDANLATDTSGFSAEAMIVAIKSFSSPHWEIRNSACLAYTALVRRMIGFMNIHKRETVRRAITSLEFFHRYPSLHSFVYEELKVATDMLQHGKSKTNLASMVHPSLCPVLILLSRLKPSPIASETGDPFDPFLFMPFIQRCSTQSNMRIRVLASRALTGLVSNEKLHSVLLGIASGLSYSRNQTEKDTEATQNKAACSHVSFNSIHGVLLQLIALLDTNCTNLAEYSSKGLILDDLVKILNKCSWIGSPGSCPCPALNTAFLRVLDHMLSIAGTCKASKTYNFICSLLSKLSLECLAVDMSDRSPFRDPTAAELRKQAAMSYFHTVYLQEDRAEEVLPIANCSTPANLLEEVPSVSSDCSDVEGRLVACMLHTSYEVRLATCKWLLQYVKTASIGTADDCCSSEAAALYDWAKTNLQTLLIGLLSQETNHKCVYYILRIVFAWNQLQFQKTSDKLCTDTVYFGETDIESVLQFWNRLVSIHESARHTKTLETLLCCFGLCVKCFADLLGRILLSDSHDSTRCTLLYEHIRFYAALIKQYSDASQQVSLRKAAADSLISSGLLEQAEVVSSSLINDVNLPEYCLLKFEPKNAVNMFAYLILETWFICITLLEDEDVSIRKELALDVQKCFPEKFRSHFNAALVPAQVEKVIELSFEFLSSILGHWDRYFDYLVRWVLDTASFVAPQGDLVRRVFDKEIDNFHEEKLLICQICCSHLENLQVSKSQQPEFLKYLRTWRERFFCQVVSFANDHIDKLEGSDWIGGVGNHKDEFLPLYGNLLGIYVLSKCVLPGGTEDGKCLISDVVELEKSVRPFLRNPLVSNLYTLIVRLHEQMLGNVSDNLIALLLKNSSRTWDGFNPYFLLK